MPSQNGSDYPTYVSEVKFYYDMVAYVYDRRLDIGERNTQDEFISGLDKADEVNSYIKFERDSGQKLLVAGYDAATFVQTIAQVLVSINPKSSTQFSSSSRVLSKSTVSRNKINAVNILNSAREHCVDPDYTSEGLYQLAFDGIDMDKCDDSDVGLLCSAIHAIASDLQKFDTSRTCAICGGTGHSFDGCPELNDAGEVRKAYIKLRVGLGRLRSVSERMRQTDLNALQSHSLSSLRMLEDSLPSIVEINRLHSSQPAAQPSRSRSESRSSKVDRVMLNAIRQTNVRLHALEQSGGGTDDDDESQGTAGSMDSKTLLDFCMGASK